MSKTILITGTTTGFGRETAETLARSGHHVFASMRATTDKNRGHAEALRRLAAAENLDIDSGRKVKESALGGTAVRMRPASRAGGTTS
jgi:NAD(P)-dependent dehydrogenase (short-subunit alcohol dehydrogenase family)